MSFFIVSCSFFLPSERMVEISPPKGDPLWLSQGQWSVLIALGDQAPYELHTSWDRPLVLTLQGDENLLVMAQWHWEEGGMSSTWAILWEKGRDLDEKVQPLWNRGFLAPGLQWLIREGYPHWILEPEQVYQRLSRSFPQGPEPLFWAQQLLAGERSLLRGTTLFPWKELSHPMPEGLQWTSLGQAPSWQGLLSMGGLPQGQWWAWGEKEVYQVLVDALGPVFFKVLDLSPGVGPEE